MQFSWATGKINLKFQLKNKDLKKFSHKNRIYKMFAFFAIFLSH